MAVMTRSGQSVTSICEQCARERWSREIRLHEHIAKTF